MSGSQPAKRKYTGTDNINDRINLLHTGVPFRTLVGTFTANAGATVNIPLVNFGIMTRLFFRVTANYTVGSGGVTASPFGPYAFLSRVVFQDYNSTQRIFAPGPLLNFLAAMRHGRPWQPTGQGLVDTQQTIMPLTAGAQQAIFSLEIPLAADPLNDLTGAIMAQTIVGQQFLQLQFNSTLIGDWFSPFLTGSAGTVTGVSYSVQVWQDAIQPQPSSRLPLLDLNSVYEFAGTFSTPSGIVTGGTAFLDYPNVRSVRGLYMTFIDAGVGTVNGTDINSLVLTANGNTQLRQQDPLNVRSDMRNRLGGDIAAGQYYIGSPRNPIQTFIYSQVQEAITFNTVGANPYISYGFESTYALQTPLPGIAAAS